MLFKQPFTAIVAGPTKAGKTVWVKNLIIHADSMIVPTPEEIYYCYTEWQPMYQELISRGVIMIEGLPDMAQLKKSINKPKLLILDDLMQEMKSEKKLVVHKRFTSLESFCSAYCSEPIFRWATSIMCECIVCIPKETQ